MIEITVLRGGKSQTIAATVGQTLMEAIPNWFGDCGGNGVCGTCHVQILSDHLIPLTEMEEFTLDLVEDLEYNSHLSCQIVLDSSMNGLIVKVIE